MGQLLSAGKSWSGHERNCCFLNTGNIRFANVSAVTGFDFPDDGRGLATVDWDHDGDLDLWTSNRTGPRVRFFRNNLAGGQHSLSVKLTGVSCNRDAIGARLELRLSAEPPRTQVTTLRAGEGYLAQSSKWVHFGIDPTATIEKLTVRWPGGDAEEFNGLKVDSRYEIIQGQPARSLPNRSGKVDLQSVEEPTAPSVDRPIRVVLTQRQPMPPFAYRDLSGRPQSLAQYRGRPLLINLWASWCLPCVKELSDFAEHREQIEASGLAVIALNFDQPNNQDNTELGGAKLTSAQQLLQRISFPFDTGLGTEELAGVFESGLQYFIDKSGPIPLPTSFLVDSSFRTAVIYQGTTSAEQILADVELLNASADRIDEASLPFVGRWVAPRPQTEAPGITTAATSDTSSTGGVLWGVTAVVMGILGFFLYRRWRAQSQRRRH